MKYYTINKLAISGCVSVRTLHYYDEINLLKPSKRTHKGHRIYSEDDLLKLQQIVTLKFIGFSLNQINNLLNAPTLDYNQALKMQFEILTKEKLRIEKIINLLAFLITQQSQLQKVNWPTINKIIETIQLKPTDNKQWYEKYFTPTELPDFNRFAKKRTKDWMDLFNETKENVYLNPASPKAKEIAQKWLLLVEEIYGDYPKLKTKLWQAYKAGMIPSDYFPFDRDVIDFLEKVDKACI